MGQMSVMQESPGGGRVGSLFCLEKIDFWPVNSQWITGLVSTGPLGVNRRRRRRRRGWGAIKRWCCPSADVHLHIHLHWQAAYLVLMSCFSFFLNCTVCQMKQLLRLSPVLFYFEIISLFCFMSIYVKNSFRFLDMSDLCYERRFVQLFVLLLLDCRPTHLLTRGANEKPL